MQSKITGWQSIPLERNSYTITNKEFLRSFFPAFFAYEVRNITKKPKFGVSEKLPYLSCLSCTEKFNNVISFWHYLEGKGLNYQVNTENKPKFKFLSPEANQVSWYKNQLWNTKQGWAKEFSATGEEN